MGFPGKFESSDFSRGNVSREMGRICMCVCMYMYMYAHVCIQCTYDNIRHIEGGVHIDVHMAHF